ncbi:glycosyltransferase [Candidatus Marinamargulisbacteria bacterium SCGC AG-333-B06]|nr:glycosyltransferase [Candidatus Marinamargulisbacteria bacterium SCGC AG-333-B06]
MKNLSIIIPIFNDEEIIEELLNRLEVVKKQLCKRFKWKKDSIEVVFATDQPTDQTLPKLKAYCTTHKGFKCINLSNRVGQYISIKAGIKESNGKAVVIMDADLQDPPEIIEPMVEQFLAGYDVVYGVRKKRIGESILYKLFCRLFYFILGRLMTTKIPEKSGEFRLLSRRAADAVIACKEANIFFRGLASWIGFKQKAVYFDRDKRFKGKTKYSFKRSVDYAIDGIISFSSKPLRYIMYFGWLIAFAGFSYAGYVLYLKVILNVTGQGWASLVVIILALGGLQLVALGIIGEYIGRIYTEVKQRPLYFIQDIFEKK